MSLGWGDILTLTAGVAGFKSGSKDQTITSPQIDPRLAQYYYGEDGKGGLLKDAADLYKQQIQMGGLNDLQRAGMNRIVDLYQSPTYLQGQNMMGSIGQGIMSKYADKFGGGGFTPFNPQSNVRVQAQQPVAQQPVAQQQTQTVPLNPFGFPIDPSINSNPADKGKGYQGSGQNPSNHSVANIDLPSLQKMFGGNTNPGGQGINNDVANAALKALAMGENKATMALSPTAAVLAKFLGGLVADKQTDAMGAASQKLAASQSLSDVGIGTTSDANGNVRTYSTPDSIAAADALAFGIGPSWDDAEATRAALLGQTGTSGGSSYGLSQGRNLGSMGGGQGIGGTANTGGYGFRGFGGLGLKGTW